MYIHGSFINRQGNTITVHVVTGNDRAEDREIGAESSGLLFTEDPVDINSEVNDTFDHLLRRSASVRLLARNFMADFFCTSCREAVANIYRDDVCLFAGFIEPQTYSQPYNEIYDEVELNCIDALAALQYSKYKDVGSKGVIYAFAKEEAEQRTFYDIMTGILDGITKGLDLVGGGQVRYLYDGSKAVSNVGGNRYTVFKDLSITDSLFLGREEDDVWGQDEVLEELMRYLNLHIIQEGLVFYIFSWETAKAADASISWRNIVNGQVSTTARKEVQIETAIAADCDTTINIGEVYNQILLTCKVEEVESVVESPLEEDALEAPYPYFQKYCTEYSSDGEGRKAFRAFYDITHDASTDYGGAGIVDWFIQTKSHSAWIFPERGNTEVDLVKKFCSPGNTDQHILPNWLGANPGAAIFALGSIETNAAKTDNSLTAKVNMANNLVVSVNGNGKDGENEYYPDADDIKANIPYAVYNGSSIGGVFSPADDTTTNYIVLSGKVVLNPLMEMTATYRELHTDTSWRDKPYSKFYEETVPSRTNKDGRYYTRQYWASRGLAEGVTLWDSSTDYGLIPFSGKGPEWYEFKYSAVGDGTDTISKVAVLACMLIIGDKCVVEKQGSDGKTWRDGYEVHSDFEWKKYKKLEECSDEDEYYRQSFTIGFDPKIGDKLIGREFDLQNNISYTLGIDAEGIAIPIRRSDKVSGVVKFMILGPVNTVWDEITRRHPTFFRHTKWTSKSIPLLAHVSNIMIKQFDIKVCSDNGLINNTENNDIIYMSDTREEFTNKKDDLEFKINSALTADECKALGVTNSVKQSTPVNTSTGEAILAIYDYTRGIQAKPEQLYVDSYYNEYHMPRILMEQKLTDTGGIIGLFNHYVHPALNKAFFVQGISRNLVEGRADLTIKEIGE